MRRFVYIGICFMFFTATAWAETLYISDAVDIDVRRGQGVEYRIVALLQPGDRITLLETDSGWSRIQMQDGKEGWILNRFLTKQRPFRAEEHQELLSKQKELASNHTLLTEENRNLKTLLEQKEQELASAKGSYESLRAESSDFIEVKNKLDAANSELADLKNKYGQLEITATKLRNNQITEGLLTGGGILVVGFLMGMFSRKKRRQSSLL